MAKKIGSLVIDVAGTTLTSEDRELIAHPLVGGVILFARNDGPLDQLTSLIHAIRATREAPLLIMVDQEGGRVQRFTHELIKLPPVAHFGDLFDQHPKEGLVAAREGGWLMAAELLSLGVDFSLAPVLDLNKKMSQVIGNRAFHGTSEGVIALTKAYIHGMKEAGMASVGKHFPGHGAVIPDSHIHTPVDERPLKEISQDDLQPFAALIQHGLPAIMAAHIIFPAIDSKTVGFSRIWLQDILRKQLHFEGAILSDDLNMAGANISANYAERVALAKEAGCDFTLLCNNREGVIAALDQLPSNAYQLDIEKWGPLQGQFKRLDPSFRKSIRFLKIKESLAKLNPSL